MLLAMGLLRLGFLANFLSRPVISGFISASAIFIAAEPAQDAAGRQGRRARSCRLLIVAGAHAPTRTG